MAVLPVYSLKDFAWLFQSQSLNYPFYAVLLYSPTNGLDGRLHKYVAGHWLLINRLTGDNCLLLAVEDIRRAESRIEEFKPEEIYDIARHLGASVRDIPCLVYFTEPEASKDTVVLQLGDLLSDSGAVDDERLTRLFRNLSAIVDSCHDQPAARRLDCLRHGIAKEWPGQSRAEEWVRKSLALGVTVAQTIIPLIASVGPLII